MNARGKVLLLAVCVLAAMALVAWLGPDFAGLVRDFLRNLSRALF